MTKAKQQETLLLTKEEATASKKWFVFDAKGKVLGRLASEIAKVLKGKHKVDYTPHIDCGDGVIVLNAKDVKVTGAKERRKNYYRHTGFVGGLRTVPYEVMKERNPEFIIRQAVSKMISRSRQKNSQLTRLRIFKGEEHSLQAQKPEIVNV